MEMQQNRCIMYNYSTYSAFMQSYAITDTCNIVLRFTLEFLAQITNPLFQRTLLKAYFSINVKFFLMYV
ncbi:hypothetical protein FKM82_006085 [Ascaphus truei]